MKTRLIILFALALAGCSTPVPVAQPTTLPDQLGAADATATQLFRPKS